MPEYFAAYHVLLQLKIALAGPALPVFQLLQGHRQKRQLLPDCKSLLLLSVPGFLRVLFQGQHRGHGKQQPDQHHSDKYAGHTDVA